MKKKSVLVSYFDNTGRDDDRRGRLRSSDTLILR